MTSFTIRLSARVAELKAQEQRLLSSISQLGGTEGAGLRQREEKLSQVSTHTHTYTHTCTHSHSYTLTQWELDLQRREERLRSETSDREFMLTERERDVQHREDEVHMREKEVKHKEFDLMNSMDSHDNTGEKLASLASK